MTNAPDRLPLRPGIQNQNQNQNLPARPSSQTFKPAHTGGTHLFAYAGGSMTALRLVRSFERFVYAPASGLCLVGAGAGVVPCG